MRLHHSSSRADRSEIAASLFRRLNSYRAKSKTMRQALSLIQEEPTLSVSQLAEELNCCPRHCQRLFVRELRIAPKDYIQLFRVSLIMRHLQEEQRGKLTDLAYQLGFSDQSHLNRVFKQFTGLAPSAFLE